LKGEALFKIAESQLRNALEYREQSQRYAKEYVHQQLRCPARKATP
jgi:hypothetical protein